MRQLPRPPIDGAYLEASTRTNICTNYLGTPAEQRAPPPSISICRRDRRLVVVVNEVNRRRRPRGYNRKVSGFFANTDGGGVCPAVTELSPRQEWIGLKNSDDVGTNFDLKAEVYKNSTLIGSGETVNVSGGSSGFNNAKNRARRPRVVPVERPVPLRRQALHQALRQSHGATGHRSGTARLWFNDSQADTHFDATINGTTSDPISSADSASGRPRARVRS